MEPLKLTVQGASTIYHRAERAMVTVSVTSEGPTQIEVSKNVTKTSNELRTILKDLALKSETGEAAPDAPITHWTMTSLSTGSHQAEDDKGNKLPRQYTATTRFEVKFQDFSELGSFATTMSTMEYVSIERIQWRLTDRTEASLGTRSRKQAVNDAVMKAKDYADALRPSHGLIVATTVTGGYSTSSVQSSMGYKRRVAYGHGHGQLARDTVGAVSEDLNFEPESITLNANVTVNFSTE